MCELGSVWALPWLLIDLPSPFAQAAIDMCHTLLSILGASAEQFERPFTFPQVLLFPIAANVMGKLLASKCAGAKDSLCCVQTEGVCGACVSSMAFLPKLRKTYVGERSALQMHQFGPTVPRIHTWLE